MHMKFAGDYNIKRTFIEENKDMIVCEPSGRPYIELEIDRFLKFRLNDK